MISSSRIGIRASFDNFIVVDDLPRPSKARLVEQISGAPDAASLPTAFRKPRWREPPPSRRVEVTGQCATLTSAGSTPVACSARAICQGEDAPGSHARSRHASPDADPLPSQLASVPDRVTRCEMRTSARAEGKARAARRVPIADRCSPHPGLSRPRTIGEPFLRPEHVHPGGQRTQHGNLDQVVVVEMPCRLHARVVDARRRV